VLYRGGLRAAEALALHPKDVDVDRGTVTILHGKGGKRRTVGVDPEALAVVEQWLTRRKQLGLHRRRSELFCTPTGRSLQPSYVRTLLPRLAARAGIEKRVHPHGPQTCPCRGARIEGFPVNPIQAQLGHSSLATTDRYLRHIAPRELVSAMQTRVWSPAGESA
jgi:integrase